MFHPFSKIQIWNNDVWKYYRTVCVKRNIVRQVNQFLSDFSQLMPKKIKVQNDIDCNIDSLDLYHLT